MVAARTLPNQDQRRVRECVWETSTLPLWPGGVFSYAAEATAASGGPSHAISSDFPTITT
jgi:hypothetical protein